MRTSAIPKMMPLLDDPEDNTYDLVGWKQLDSTTGHIRHNGSTWSRVDDAALWALQSISLHLDHRFTYRKTDPNTIDADIAAAISDAKKWYAKIKDQL